MALLAPKAAFLPDSRTLLVADAHIGKAVSFRRLGVPVPRGTTSQTLAALSILIDGLAVRRIVFLGDFLHGPASHAASTMRTLLEWRLKHASTTLTLVRGNHDDRAGDPPAALGFEVVGEPWHLGGLALCHYPQVVDGSYVLAGHLHPCVTVLGRARERLRLPCFWFGARGAVLPAFGAFTGMQAVSPAAGDRLYAIAGDAVMALPGTGG